MGPIYGNLRVLYKEKGQYEVALEYLQKGIKVEIEALGETHEEVATSYLNMGILSKRMGDYEAGA